MNTKKQHIENDVFDITALIRSIQRAEGNLDCFRKAKGYCDQLDCYWRPYCLGKKSLS
ncbi:MAG: SAP domain-containing protein [Deltaproteobacteria bacterium]|nr:SAP domain-containing protein [Deltaproteobacteria bacterium]